MESKLWITGVWPLPDLQNCPNPSILSLSLLEQIRRWNKQLLSYSFILTLYYSSNSNIILLYYRYYLGCLNCNFFYCNPNTFQNPQYVFLSTIINRHLHTHAELHEIHHMLTQKMYIYLLTQNNIWLNENLNHLSHFSKVTRNTYLGECQCLVP